MMDDKIALKASKIKSMLKRRLLSQLETGIFTRPLNIEGHAGIGKSEIVRQAIVEFAEEYKDRNFAKKFGGEAQCRTTNLQFCEPPDFLGLPFVKEHEGEEVTRHARPEILPKDGFGIWFLDEANRASRDNRAGMLTLIQDRNVNGHALGAGWMIVMAQNPQEADGVSYEVSEYDAALQDRITPVSFMGDVKEFTTYIVDKYGDTNPVVRWVMNEPFIVDFKGKTRTSPRSLEFLIKALEAEGGVDELHSFEVIAAEIGQSGATAFTKFMGSVKNITAEEVLDKWGPEIIEKLDWAKETGRNDVLNTLLHGIVSVLSQRMPKLDVKVKPKTGTVSGLDKDKFTKQIDNFVEYLEKSDADYVKTFFMVGRDNLTRTDFVKIVDYIVSKSDPIVKIVLESKNSSDET